MKLRRVIMWAAGLLLVLAIALTMRMRPNNPASAHNDIPLAMVRRGRLDLIVYARGELRASRSVTLTAPAISGGTLKITHLLHTGVRVKKGDTVAEFDPSEQKFKLEQSRSELLQAEQEITKAKADAAVQAAQDKVALLKARFDVRRAELEIQKNELVSSIDATKNQLALEQAKRALTELDQDIKSHATAGQAGTTLAQEKWKKASLAMDQAEQNIKKMSIAAPMDGLVAIEQNLDARDMFLFGGALPDYREGDQASPGAAVARVVDPREMELVIRVSELERSNIRIGESADVVFDALPDQTFRATVKSAGEMAQREFIEFFLGGSGKYEAVMQLPDADSRLRPGLTANVAVSGGSRANTLYIFRQALFQKDGRQIIYLSKGTGFEQHQIKVQGANESRVAVEGVKEGDEVALVDPTVPRRNASENPMGPGETP